MRSGGRVRTSRAYGVGESVAAHSLIGLHVCMIFCHVEKRKKRKQKGKREKAKGKN